MSEQPASSPSETVKLLGTIHTIEGLNGGAERRLPWERIRQYINTITDGHVTLAVQLPNDLKIYRARTLETAERFTTISELKAREHDAVTSYGRCNKPGQSIFYGALNLETVVSEMGLSVGDKVQVLSCHPDPDKTIVAAILGEVDYLRRYGVHSAIGFPDMAKAVRDHWNSLSEISRLRLNLTDAFMADVFRREVKQAYEYKITSAISDELFSRGLDAFFYPSVGHLGGWNIAIKKEVAEERLKIVGTTVHSIYDALGYGIFGHHVAQESSNINEDGTIEYVDRSSILAFRSFDELIYYWSCKLEPHRIVCLAMIGTQIEAGDLEAAPDLMKDTPEGVEPMRFSAGTDFSIPVTPDLEFSRFKKLLNEKQPDWTGFLVEVVPEEGPDAAVKHLRARMDKDGGFGLMIFSKDGEMRVMAKAVKKA